VLGGGGGGGGVGGGGGGARWGFGGGFCRGVVVGGEGLAWGEFVPEKYSPLEIAKKCSNLKNFNAVPRHYVDARTREKT